MKNWVKVIVGTGAGLAALFLLLRRGAPSAEQPPPEQPVTGPLSALTDITISEV